jgi:hypothetical protein
METKLNIDEKYINALKNSRGIDYLVALEEFETQLMIATTIKVPNNEKLIEMKKELDAL